MPYVNITEGGQIYKKFQHADGSYSDVFVPLSMVDGINIKLSQSQLDALRSPISPTDYPLPTAQFDALKPRTLPTVYPLPDAQVTALTSPSFPSNYPLPTTEKGYLETTATVLSGLAKGSGSVTAATLRATIASDNPPIPVVFSGGGTATIGAPIIINGSTTASILLSSSTTRRYASVYNASSSATLYLALGDRTVPTVQPTEVVSANSYHFQIRPGDLFEVPTIATGAALSGVWSTATGAKAMITSIS